MGQPRRSTRVAAKATAAPAATPTPTKKQSQKSTPSSTKKATPSSTKKGLRGQEAPDTAAPLGDVDPQSGFGDTAIIAQDDEGSEEYNVMLSLIDLSQNMDKYYILQVVQEPKGSKLVYHCYSRWGRTGTAGQSQTFTFDDKQEAVDKFEEKFQEKTAHQWADRKNFAQKPGKYNLLNNVSKNTGPAAMWQYYVDDNVDGKANGWYDYDDSAAEVVEDLQQQRLANPNMDMNTRVVQSGHFLYVVDLEQGTQTNTTTHKTRAIRRTVNGCPALVVGAAPGAAAGPSASSPAPASASKRKGRSAAAAASSAPATPTAGPSKRQKSQGTSAAAAQTPTPAKSKAASTPASKTKAAAANVVSGQDLVKAMGSGNVDPTCPKSSTATLVPGYDVMLNQTDIKANKNKFYLIQLIDEDGQMFVWTRWGRVGDVGMSQLQGPMDLEDGEAEFAKKFKSKTGNEWEDRADFEVKAGKYEIVEIEAADPSQQAAASTSVPTGPVLPCTLDPKTKSFVDLIFDEDMFKSAMSALDLDTDRIPLGRLSKAQVQKGIDILEEIEATIKKGGDTVDLSSSFYQAIPHNCGRKQPPALKTLAEVQNKFDLLNVLGDIEVAQTLMKTTAGPLHPTDAKYQQLQADLRLLDKSDAEFKVLEKYLQNTKGSDAKIDGIWALDRHGEAARFSPHASITNRKLLWHGTNIAVVAAILKSGLRIMPHSGGRVGRGIYLASECGKSQTYVTGTTVQGKYLGVMFLVEAALGKEHHITRDDSSLTQPPKGCNAVVAMGRQEPDPKMNTTITVDGQSVVVPQGKPVNRPQYSSSSFWNSEYLLYDESQHRIRYVLTVWL